MTRRLNMPVAIYEKVFSRSKYTHDKETAVRIAEIVGLAGNTQSVKAQQAAAKNATKNARRAALQLKLHKTQQQIADLAKP